MADRKRLARSVRVALLPLLAVLGLATCSGRQGIAADSPGSQEYLAFIRTRAAALRAGDGPPSTLDEWRGRREALRRRLTEAWGGFPADPCPLEPRTLGVIAREGYRVEKVVFQTFPGVWMTANAYVPEQPGRRPAILAVHGHWRGAKQDPVVQARCIGAAKLGFFVLAVDAFGAGERGVGKALGEYHGALTAATLLPVGRPLSGLQVYENMRAVDYLRSRPEVDGQRIGITGASGGGNQTMYAGAWDDRFRAAVPVCSIGNYQAYLGVACCLCEVVPGALRFTEEWGVLGLTVPRALMIINATQDAPQFSVAEAKKSVTLAEPLFRLYDQPGHLRHAIFESKHDYNRAMREAMYGWMMLHLKGEGEGAPMVEPEVQPEDPESLRCYPGDTRPDDWITIPRFASERARELLSSRTASKDADAWRSARGTRLAALVEKVFGGFPEVGPVSTRVEPVGVEGARLIHFQPEPGLNLTARHEAGKGTAAPLAILIDLDGAEKAAAGPLAAEVRRAGWGLVTLDLRATGALATPTGKAARVSDHNTAEWALWIGRPLLGQWTFDVRRLLDALERADGMLPRDVVLAGEGPGGIVALCAGAVDRRITRVATVGTLASYITDRPYTNQMLGIMAPGILRDVGDVADLAALNAPRRLIIAGGVAASGDPLAAEPLRATYRDASQTWELLDAGQELRILETTDPAEIVRALAR